MKRISVLLIALLWLGSMAKAEVFLLKGNFYLEYTKIIKNEAWVLTIEKDGQLYKIHDKNIVQVTDTIPENFQPLDLARIGEYSVPLPEPVVVTPEPIPSVMVEKPGEKPIEKPVLEAPFEIPDVRWVDDVDVLWTGGLNGSYQAKSDRTSNDIQVRKAYEVLSCLKLDTAFSWKGYMPWCDWTISLPAQFVTNPNWLINSDRPAVSSSGQVNDQEEGVFYYGPTFLSLGFAHDGYYGYEWSTNHYLGDVKLGVGRIYRGKHAYQALQMIHDLGAEEKLLKPLSIEDMQEVCAIIVRERDKYVFDKRSENLEAVEKIATFLTDKGYIQGVRSILLVDDLYRYITEQERDFGMRAFVKFQKERKGNYQVSPVYVDWVQSTAIGIGCEAALPLSRTWQLNAQVGLDRLTDYGLKGRQFNSEYRYNYGQYYTYESSVPTEERASALLCPYLDVSLQYLPSTRCVITLSNQLKAMHGKMQEWETKTLYGYDYSNYYFTNNYQYNTMSVYDYTIANVEYTAQLSVDYQISQVLNLLIAAKWNWITYKQQDVFEKRFNTHTQSETEYHLGNSLEDLYSTQVTVGMKWRVF